MSDFVSFSIDGKECMAERGQYLVDAAAKNNVFIPTLCNYSGVRPQGSCRICTVLVNGNPMTACTTPVAEGMEVENNDSELQELRKAIVELLFAEGNHFCPACERSGDCELQALGYRYNMLVPRFPFIFPYREVEATHPKLIKDHNRCILCKRCIRALKDDRGRSLFAFAKRGNDVMITIDTELSHEMGDEMVDRAVKVCPVGALNRRGVGFSTPIGERTYDRAPIGSDVEQQ